MRIHLSKPEQEKARRWLRDDAWMVQEKYRQDPEYLDCVQDILDHPVFQSMEHYYQHGKTTCLDHCIRVSYLSYQICLKYGFNERETARAALLHDLFLYDWHTHARETGEHFHGFTHPRVAMKNAIRYFDITKMQQDIILRHMWPLTPVPPKYKEGYVLVFADKYCSMAEVADKMKHWFACNRTKLYGR